MADKKTILMLDKKLFDELLSQGRTGEILAEGGINLTPQQLKLVKEKAKEQADEKLMQRKMSVAASPGYQDFMTMPLMSKIFSNLFTNQPQTARPENQMQQAQFQASDEKQPKGQKDPKYTNVTSGKVEKLKINDSESDIAATLYNFMNRNYKKELQRMKKEKKYQKEIQDFEDLKNKQLVSVLNNRNKKQKDIKKDKGFNLGSLLKGGLKAGLAVGGLLVIEKAFAKIADMNMGSVISNLPKVLKDDKKDAPAEMPELKKDTSSQKTNQGNTGKNKFSNTKEALKAMDFFMKNGYTEMQAAAIVGNLQAESGQNLNTRASGDEGKALGIAQWQGARQKKFKEIIGKDIMDSSLEEQLKFVDWELKNTHADAGRKLKQAKNVKEAATVIDKSYEVSAGLHTDRRIANAEKLLGLGSNLTNTTTPVVAGTKSKKTNAPAPLIDSEALRRKREEEQANRFVPMSELIKEQERKKLLNTESKNLRPEQRSSLDTDRMKQLFLNNFIIIEREKTIKEMAKVDDTSILFDRIQQLG